MSGINTASVVRNRDCFNCREVAWLLLQTLPLLPARLVFWRRRMERSFLLCNRLWVSELRCWRGECTYRASSVWQSRMGWGKARGFPHMTFIYVFSKQPNQTNYTEISMAIIFFQFFPLLWFSVSVINLLYCCTSQLCFICFRSYFSSYYPLWNENTVGCLAVPGNGYDTWAGASLA